MNLLVNDNSQTEHLVVQVLQFPMTGRSIGEVISGRHMADVIMNIEGCIDQFQ